MTGDRRAAVITCSDSVDAGRAADVSGPVAAAALAEVGADDVIECQRLRQADLRRDEVADGRVDE